MLARVVSIAALVHVATRAEVSVTEVTKNPIRKVVNMLTQMQQKVQAEGEKEKELFDKFMCYCKNGGADLGQSIAAAENKVPELDSSIRENIAQKAQLEQDLKDHQASRADAKDAMAKATQIRQKEAAAYKKESSDLTTNIGALEKAIAAIEKGMTGSFLQTTAANTIKQIALSGPSMQDGDRQELLSFLSGTQAGEYSPRSGEITGILKTLKDDMAGSLTAATNDENAAKSTYEQLMTAKKKEVQSLTVSIESKSKRVADLAVEIAMQKNDLADTQESLADDKKFLADMEKDCKTKADEWDERSQLRSQELVAISETIKVLNDDDALELFKKTLPSPALLQVRDLSSGKNTKVISIIHKLRKSAVPSSSVQLDFISLALGAKKVGFEKVIKMIDNLVEQLKTEQVDDDSKKEYCEKQFDESDDKKKALEQTISDHELAITNAEEGISTAASEIKALEKGIKALDKSVSEATEQRRSENEEYKNLVANNQAAKEIISWAKNRLNKFYNPKLYKAPPKRELEGAAASFVQIAAHGRARDAPAPPPETFGDYSKKSEDSNGVIAMMDLLVKDLDKENTEAGVEEKEAQKEYEAMMADSASKRAADSKSITQKQGMKAELETTLESHKAGKMASTKELMATTQYISSLHGECDWLIKYFQERKAARASEIDALGNAKAVLSGADYSFVQTHLRR